VWHRAAYASRGGHAEEEEAVAGGDDGMVNCRHQRGAPRGRLGRLAAVIWRTSRGARRPTRASKPSKRGPWCRLRPAGAHAVGETLTAGEATPAPEEEG
jgi:hypothetical protein